VHYAIVSCAHGNLDAFAAVVADAKSRGVERIVFLGDLVGFGPDPVGCVDLARTECAIALKGCHDQALVVGASHLPPPVRACLDWAKEEIERDGDQGPLRMQFLAELAPSYDSAGIVFLHASPRDPVGEYLFAEDVKRDTRKLSRAFSLVSKVVFVGHTHVPGVFLENPLRWQSAAEIQNYFHYKRGDKVIVNVGSCGQPRDGDPRACYLEIEKNELYWRRVDYDVNGVVAKIQANPRLSPAFAQRLLRGI
jgi:diadenosine tetraphosphatase ApaH/serine/threonine PP2A family protein phosphatase